MTNDGTFKIIVCIKQVPDTTDIKWTEKNTIQREDMDLMINPYDLGALQAALEIKELIENTKIILISMGPNQAVESLTYGLALGADRAYLLCDKKFAASDTLATSYCLSDFIKKYYPDFNLIICGQQAIDGDTAQTPVAVAEKLHVPAVTLVKKILRVTEHSITLVRETPTETEQTEVNIPAVLAIDNQVIDYQPKINDFIKAQNEPVKIIKACDIGLDECLIGCKGSPTQVKNAFRPLKEREAKIVDDLASDALEELLMSEINKVQP